MNWNIPNKSGYDVGIVLSRVRGGAKISKMSKLQTFPKSGSVTVGRRATLGGQLATM